MLGNNSEHGVVCRKSGRKFTIAEDDLNFLSRVAPTFQGRIYSLPPPTIAPDLRAMRRMAWHSSNNLYRRQCSKTGEQIISGYPAEAPYPVYANNIWWSDSWRASDFGLEFDFSRPFFEQFQQLMFQAPRPALMNRDPENSEYCNYAGQNKNCYMANNGSWYNEGCLFGEAYLHARDCVDCSYLQKSELCYEVMGGEGLYECTHLVDCYHSSNCHFSINLRSCTDCFFSSNLRNKVGYVWNRPAVRGEIDTLRSMMSSQRGLEKLRLDFAKLRLDSLHPAVHQLNCEDSSGDYLTNCHNVKLSFMVGSIRDGKYLIHCDEAQDLWDCSLSGYSGSELYYETVSTGDAGVRALFCSGSWTSNHVLYCDTVMSCNNCFGCVGLKHEEFMILNRQYSRSEYEELVPRIIEHMRETGEWGEFFPENIAPHAYNESHAMDFYPLTRSEALQLGYRWRADTEVIKKAAIADVPSDIESCTYDLCSLTLSCKETGKQYKIVPAELSLLSRLRIAPPLLAPETRRRKRAALRNKPQFWTRPCSISGEPVMTTFSPERAEKICSQESYMKVVYGED